MENEKQRMSVCSREDFDISKRVSMAHARNEAKRKKDYLKGVISNFKSNLQSKRKELKETKTILPEIYTMTYEQWVTQARKNAAKDGYEFEETTDSQTIPKED